MVGLVNGRLVAFVGIQPIVATLGMLVAGRGIALVIADGRLTEIFDPTVTGLGSGSIAGLPYPVLVAFLLTLLVAGLVRRTTFGRQLVAIGGNREAAALAGLPVRRTLVAGVRPLRRRFAAVAGVLETARLGREQPVVRRPADRAERDHRRGGRRHPAHRRPGAHPRHGRRGAADAADHRDADPARPARLVARMIQAVIILAAVYIQRDRGTA